MRKSSKIKTELNSLQRKLLEKYFLIIGNNKKRKFNKKNDLQILINDVFDIDFKLI